MLEKIKRTIYKVAIYIRLSKEDMDKGYDESESITNQKALLIEYVEKLGWEYELVDIYIDPGYTGTNFNRPDFKRMIRDIELGKINMVITKDLSRLGRDYIETGEYIEKWFPENNVRYVSVTDNIDTFATNNGNNDIAPFKSILNDMYSKDLSKKIKTALHTMQKQGKWVGGKTPLGYMKDPKDKNHLVICEEEAKIVKTIFGMAISGNNVGEIRDYLNNNNIPTTNQIRYNKATFWENKTVKLILQNKVYVGVTIQNKRSRISYKNRKLRANPEEQWQIVENTHKPIIDKNVFDRVQKIVIVQNYNRNEKKNTFLLDGLLFCYECKHKIGVRGKKNGNYYMVCNNYRRNSKLKLCTSHGFSYSNLEETIINYIKNLFKKIDSEKVELEVKNGMTKYDYRKILKKLRNEIKLINNNIDQMYVDKLNNKISEEMYERLLKKFKNEIGEKENEYLEIKQQKEESKQDNTEKIKSVVQEFLELKELTPEFMKVIINRIEIHQDKQVDLYFNFKQLNNLKEKI
ncbi:MAG: recombinase family protein [Clostridia bacterium]|jgi:site-specific DNA recombinase|nr:recombinase family protein [Clostridia bacterium]